jgi:gamma-glutamylcyclotransferase (GGCT)/AIG2-like uncharacterized protein YtfP
MGPEQRLATYGTLSPGEVNHHQLDGLEGTWSTGTVRGHRHASGWGAAVGFPGLVADPDGPVVPVHLFESPDLPGHWPHLDAFEGEGYVRTVIPVATDRGPIDAFIYLLAEKP